MKRNNMVREFSPRYPKTCLTCGEDFLAKIGTQKHCEPCRENRSRAGRGKAGRLLDRFRLCAQCESEFQLSSPTQRFCTNCRATVKKERDKSYTAYENPKRTCITCYDEYTPSGNNQKRCLYCSEISRYRKLAFENFPHICNRCGVAEHPKTANVHHKDRNRENEMLENLEILCTACHRFEHVIRGEDGKIITNI